MGKITIALDWTPNINHAGFLYAFHKGLFEKEGLEVDYISTEIDNYQRKPLTRLTEGEADLAIGPTEHLFYFGVLNPNTPDLVALASVMQPNMSAFIVKERPDIRSPRDLDGKKYLGYNTPLEEHILREMILRDGGKGEIEMITPPRLDVFDGFLQDQGDVSWVFRTWESALARHKGYHIREFIPGDYNIPYGYSTLLFTTRDKVESKGEEFTAFFRALARGYELTATDPDQVSADLCQCMDHPNFNEPEFIRSGMQVLAPALLNEDGKWGVMTSARFKTYATWLREKKMVQESEYKEIVNYEIMDNRFVGK